jgi:hypothetical protein
MVASGILPPLESVSTPSKLEVAAEVWAQLAGRTSRKAARRRLVTLPRITA